MYLLDAEPGKVPRESIWVYRFYDVSAASLTKQAHRPAADEGDLNQQAKFRKFDMLRSAENLMTLIDMVKDRTGAPRVHSMGGLICRCLIQKVLPDRKALPMPVRCYETR